MLKADWGAADDGGVGGRGVVMLIFSTTLTSGRRCSSIKYIRKWGLNMLAGTHCERKYAVRSNCC